MNRFMSASCAVYKVRTRAGPGWRQSFTATSGAVQGILLMLGIHIHPINNCNKVCGIHFDLVFYKGYDHLILTLFSMKKLQHCLSNFSIF